MELSSRGMPPNKYSQANTSTSYQLIPWISKRHSGIYGLPICSFLPPVADKHPMHGLHTSHSTWVMANLSILLAQFVLTACYVMLPITATSMHGRWSVLVDTSAKNIQNCNPFGQTHPTGRSLTVIKNSYANNET